MINKFCKFGLIALFILTFNVHDAEAQITAVPKKNTSLSSVLKDAPEHIPTLQGGTAEDKMNHITFAVIDFVLMIAGVLAVFFITLSGARLVASTGGQDEIDAAKRTLLYAILGLLAVILSWALVTNVVRVLYLDKSGSATGSTVDVGGSDSGSCAAVGDFCLIDSSCCSNNCSSSKCKP